MSEVPTAPVRIAIIGSGPSGFYAADALLKQTAIPVRVDLFDRLPTPYGLVRGGVAPDHASIKNVIRVYEKVSAHLNFRFFGNVTLGRDLTVDDLAANYDQWIYAVGAARDRKLGVPGEDLAGSHSATEFVGWYNGHPDFRGLHFDLSVSRVAVIGVGIVAMDVTRILAQDPEKLAKTDIAAHALEALRGSGVEEIVVFGRRGVAQAAFSPTEIEEIAELDHAALIVDPAELRVDAASEADLAEANAQKNLDFLREWVHRTVPEKPRRVRLRFLASPVEILGENGQVRAIRIEKNRLEASERGANAVGTGVFEDVPVGMVLRSVGYHGVAIPGVPFDARTGRIPNDQGQVLDQPGGQVLPHQYVVGWAKRGPSGLIGTNRGDAIATVQRVLADAAQIQPKAISEGSIPALLAHRGVRATSFHDWKRIDAVEVAAGAASGKPREKITRVDEMLAILDTQTV